MFWYATECWKWNLSVNSINTRAGKCYCLETSLAHILPQLWSGGPHTLKQTIIIAQCCMLITGSGIRGNRQWEDKTQMVSSGHTDYWRTDIHSRVIGCLSFSVLCCIQYYRLSHVSIQTPDQKWMDHYLKRLSIITTYHCMLIKGSSKETLWFQIC